MATQKFVGPWRRRRRYWQHSWFYQNWGPLRLPYSKSPESIGRADIVASLRYMGAPGVWNDDPAESSWRCDPFAFFESSSAGVDPLEDLSYEDPGPMWVPTDGVVDRYNWGGESFDQGTLHFTFWGQSGGQFRYYMEGGYSLYQEWFYIYELRGVGGIVPILGAGLPVLGLFAVLPGRFPKKK